MRASTASARLISISQFLLSDIKAEITNHEKNTSFFLLIFFEYFFLHSNAQLMKYE